MLTFTETQILEWISPLIWPFVRMLSLFGSMPVLAQRSVPVRVRVALAFLITFCAQASLPAMPVVPLDSAPAMMMLAQQVLIGVSMGFAARIVFAAIELAGELVGLQMGLNFAGFFDPATGGQTTAMSRFFGTTISWLFIVVNGHLLIMAGAESSGTTGMVGSEAWAQKVIRKARATRTRAGTLRCASTGIEPNRASMRTNGQISGLIHSRTCASVKVSTNGQPTTLGIACRVRCRYSTRVVSIHGPATASTATAAMIFGTNDSVAS